MFLSAYTREGCVRQETERAGPRGPLCPHCAPPRLPLGPQAVTCLTEDPGCAALSCLPLALIPVGPTQDFIEGNRIAGPPNLVTVEGGWCLLSPVGYGVGCENMICLREMIFSAAGWGMISRTKP